MNLSRLATIAVFFMMFMSAFVTVPTYNVGADNHTKAEEVSADDTDESVIGPLIILLLIIGAILVVILMTTIVQIEQYESGVALRLGKYHSMLLRKMEPGIISISIL